MQNTCEIQWVNSQGDATPDTNKAIGTVYCEEYSAFIAGRTITFNQTKRFRICAEHAKRLSEKGMYHWHFERNAE